MSLNSIVGLGSHSVSAIVEGGWLLQDDAASDTIAEFTGVGSDGTLFGGDNTSDISTTGPNGYLPKAIALDGSADLITISCADIRSQGAIFIRVRLDSTPSGPRTLISHRSGGSANDRIYVRFNNSTEIILSFGNQSTIASGVSLTVGVWYTVAVIWSGSNCNLYLDGTSVASTTTASVSGDSWQGFRLGCFWQPGSSNANFLDCTIADVLVLDAATTADEAQWRGGPELKNVVTPGISGTETEGETLTCSTGTWELPSPFSSGTNGTPTYSYQWTRSDDDSGTGEANIGGATSSTYELTSGDVGKYLRCVVRAANTGGFDSAEDTYSAFTGAIADGGGPAQSILPILMQLGI